MAATIGNDKPEDMRKLSVLCEVAHAEAKRYKRLAPSSSSASSSSSSSNKKIRGDDVDGRINEADDRTYDWVRRGTTTTIRSSNSSSSPLISTSTTTTTTAYHTNIPIMFKKRTTLIESTQAIPAPPRHGRGWMQETCLGRCGGAVPPVHFGIKKMTATDLSPTSNRFLFTREMQHLLLRGMDAEEHEGIHSDEGLGVRVFDRRGRVFEMILKVWPSNDWIVLRGKSYIKFVEANTLGQHDEVDVWVFRLIIGGPKRILCFALVGGADA